ncbi:hypothetical protein BH09SUM1_BH09SUM1_09110 [soil metagenome]
MRKKIVIASLCLLGFAGLASWRTYGFLYPSETFELDEGRIICHTVFKRTIADNEVANFESIRATVTTDEKTRLLTGFSERIVAAKYVGGELVLETRDAHQYKYKLNELFGEKPAL